MIPQLWTSLWRKDLSNINDLQLKLSPRIIVYDKNHHDKLALTICLPPVSSQPWCHRDMSNMDKLEGQMQGLWEKIYLACEISSAQNLHRSVGGSSRARDVGALSVTSWRIWVITLLMV